jgi:membrane protein DedA with SNARE-associated domain/rhodanese-related sulfurtransferase
MSEITQMLVRHGSLVVFLLVWVEQMGVPLPAAPLLLVAGALSTTGKFQLGWGLVWVVAACLLGDGFWFYLGRTRGNRVLGVLCRMSLEPDSCVRRTNNIFTRFGLGAVVVAKFVPGLSTLAPPLAGMSRVGLGRFLAADGFGALLYGVVYLLAGRLFSGQIQQITDSLDAIGRGAFLLMAGALAIYLGVKSWQRRRTLRELRMARITVAELRQKLAAAEQVVILDLRSSLERTQDPAMIPGALPLGLDELEARHHEIPRDREIVVYCSCPNEVSSARMATLLRRRGVTRIRPLLGGIAAWKEEALAS